MARLDVYSLSAKGHVSYLLDVQTDLLGHIGTRTVVPLVPENAGAKPISGLNPVFEVLGKRYVMVSQAIATVYKRELKQPAASLAHEHDAITRALDILLTGF